MTNKLVIINSLKVPKIKKILLHEMKFLVPNYSCLQNSWLGGLQPPDPRSLCPLSTCKFVEPTPPLHRTKFLGTPLYEAPGTVRDFKLPPQSRWELRSSGLLRTRHSRFGSVPSEKCATTSMQCRGRVQLKCDGTRWRTGGEVKGKLANGVSSQYSTHYLWTWCIQHYYRWCAHLGCQ